MGVSAMPTAAEIGVLEALAAQGETLTAKAVAGAPPYRTRLAFVDPGRRFLVLERGHDGTPDAALLARDRVELLVEWGEWRIGFAGDHPEACVHEGAEAIRIGFPEAVSISRRRMLPRAAVPQASPLRCVVHPGAASAFEAEVTDVSQGGVGMQADPRVALVEPGMVLAACRLERAGREPVIVDLEVRHTSRVALAGGRTVARIGCRFVHLSPAAMGLVAEVLAASPPS